MAIIANIAVSSKDTILITIYDQANLVFSFKFLQILTYLVDTVIRDYFPSEINNC